MIRGFQGSDRCVGDFGDLFIFELIEVSHIEYDPLFFRQLLYGFMEFSLQLVSVEIRVVVYFFSQDIH